MKVREITERERTAWSDFVASMPASNLCHEYSWHNVISKTFKHKPFYLQAEDASGTRGILPLFFVKSFLFGKGLISLPYLNAGGVLSDSPEANEILQQEAINLFGSMPADYLELRLRAPIVSDEKLILRQHKVSFVLDLPMQSEQLRAAFSTKLRSQINRPIKAGAKCICYTGEQIDTAKIRAFYRIFSRHNRDLGTPVYPISLFENVCREFAGNVLLAFVELNGSLTSAALVIKHKQMAEIVWASSLKKYHALSVNMLLYWGVMEELCRQGCAQFDFGRCSYNSGGYNFKKQWGGNELPLYWYYYGADKFLPDVNPKSEKFSFATKVWQKLPLLAANQLGPILTRHLP